MVIFHCYVKLPEGNGTEKRMKSIDEIHFRGFQSISVSGAGFREMYYSFTFFGIVRSSFPTWK
jgi:hypothetical protein